ncbi:tetratricopeptide repeat protein [Thiotrichales bacterium 19S9-12]|nr:tetratricopeptide repeat protein [Thiotrichales bacterium 19S9-11]MCF6811451.1 tetratricopeptide repeat protein [Thiotrichales bacterium 19S9-12]
MKNNNSKSINDIMILCQEGKFDQAEELCHSFLKQNEHDINILYLLGDIYVKQKQLKKAVYYFTQIVGLNPKHHEAYYNLAIILSILNKLDEAIINYKKVIQIQPDYYKAHYGLASIYLKQNKFNKAADLLKKAVQINPNHYQSHNSLGVALHNLDQLDNATTHYKIAAKLNPRFDTAYYNLAQLLKDQLKLHKAIANYQIAIKINPNSYKAYNDLGIIYKDQQKFNEAAICYQKAIQINPRYHNAYFNLGIMQLYSFDFENGWKNYQYRRLIESNNIYILQTDKPEYINQALDNKTLYLYHEQGLGDTIMILRFLNHLIQISAHIVLYIPVSLVQIVKDNFPTVEITTTPYQKYYDFHLPVMSIPAIMKINRDNMPLTDCYLSANSSTIQFYKTNYFQNNKQKIGIVWKGKSIHQNDKNRSLSLSSFLERINRKKNQQYYSLQMETSDDEKKLLSKNNIIDLGASFSNFSQTAAAISSLDHIISIDSSIVHLAGALSIATWVLLPNVEIDWRWGYQGETSYWYDSVRLIRDDRMISL